MMGDNSNDVIAGQNDPLFKLLPSSVIWTPTAQAKQQNKLRNPTIETISDLNPNCLLPSRETKETSTPSKCRVNDERPAGKKNTTIEWDDGEK